MANGTITVINENGVNLAITVNIGGAVYTTVVDKPTFDALPTNVDKQNYVITLLTNIRRTTRLYENIYPALIGNVIVIPD